MGSPVNGLKPMEHVSTSEALVIETPPRNVEANHEPSSVPTEDPLTNEGLRYFLESGSDSDPPAADSQIESIKPITADPSLGGGDEVLSPQSLEIGSGPLTSYIEYRPDGSGPSNIWDLAYVRQVPGEPIRQYWARFLSVKSKILDYQDSDIIAAFERGCEDKAS